jgi:hypothetical protein
MKSSFFSSPDAWYFYEMYVEVTMPEGFKSQKNLTSYSLFTWAEIWLIWLFFLEKNTAEWLDDPADNIKRTG